MIEPFEISYRKHVYTIIPDNRNLPGRRFYFKVMKDGAEIGLLKQQDDESCCWEANDGRLSESEMDYLSEAIETKYLKHS
jgi:hypothetical protein